jgi:hypothetical protein
MNSAPLTAFTWGYWGWGTSVPQFLEAAAAAESAGGFAPPAFADVRLRRAVRAPGFRDAAFEKAVGPERYRWFSGLGNANIGTEESGVRIARPEDSGILLDYIVEQWAASRRVLFFCACPADQDQPCHRHTVASLLLETARARDVRLTVVEWPGGEPEARELRLTPTQIRANRATAIPLGKKLPANGLATLPWGSTLLAGFGKGVVVPILVGPAEFRGEWRLPKFVSAEADDETGQRLQREARDLRERVRANPRSSSEAGAVGQSHD